MLCVRCCPRATPPLPQGMHCLCDLYTVGVNEGGRRSGGSPHTRGPHQQFAPVLAPKSCAPLCSSPSSPSPLPPPPSRFAVRSTVRHMFVGRAGRWRGSRGRESCLGPFAPLASPRYPRVRACPRPPVLPSPCRMWQLPLWHSASVRCAAGVLPLLTLLHMLTFVSCARASPPQAA